MWAIGSAGCLALTLPAEAATANALIAVRAECIWKPVKVRLDKCDCTHIPWTFLPENGVRP